MSVIDTLKTSGALPLNELNVRTPGTERGLLAELKLLQQDGLVKIEGDLPDSAGISILDDTQISLTLAGLRGALA